MFPLIESIRLCDGEFARLAYHERRMIDSLETAFGVRPDFSLEKLLRACPSPPRGLYKCRLSYGVEDLQLRHTVEFVPYRHPRISSLKVVDGNGVDYTCKYADRRAIDELFKKRDSCDDILIVQSGRISDTSFANIVFRQAGKWYTPSTPLLWGTMRQNLLDRGYIVEADIGISDIRAFEAWKPVNAMLEFDAPEFDVSAIVV